MAIESVIDQGIKSAGSIPDLIRFMTDVQQRAIPSVTAFTKRTNIISNAYIEEILKGEDVCPPLMGMLCQMYCGYIITALNMNNMVVNGRTVREILEAISVEGMVDSVAIAKADFGNPEKMRSQVVGYEARVVDLDPPSQKLYAGRVIELTLDHRLTVQSVEETNRSGNERSISRDTTTGSEDSKSHDNPNGKVVEKWRGTDVPGTIDPDKTHHYPPNSEYDDPDEITHERTTGKDSQGSKSSKSVKDSEGAKNSVDTTKKTSTKSEAGTITLYLYVQIFPNVIQSQSLEGFVTLNFTPPLSQRWKMVRAGEIKFFKDFIFGQDLVKKFAQTLKASRKDPALAQMLEKTRNKLATHWWHFVASPDGKHNLANSIVVISEETLNSACNAVGMDFSSNQQRQAFFAKTYAMFVVVVDQQSNIVTLYLNGIDTKGTYSFSDINKSAKGKDGYDLKDVMTVMSQGMMPKI